MNNKASNKLIYIAALVIAIILPLVSKSEYYLFLLGISGIYTILTLSLNFMLGYLGLVSIGHAGFFAIGAYISAALTVYLNMSFWVSVIMAGLASTIFGAILCSSAIRVKGHYFILVTLGFGEIVRLVLMNWKSVTRGTDGIAGIPLPRIGPLVFNNKVSFYYIILFFVIVTVYVSIRIKNSRFGRSFTAIKNNEVSAQIMGIDLTYNKMIGFSLSAFFAGIAGSLYAHYFTFISPEVFTVEESVLILCMLLVGGSGSIAGSIIGATFLTFLPELLRFLKEFYLAIYGAGIVAVIIFMPYGIVGLIRNIETKIKWKEG